ncbi:MAG: FG-GAP repeat protein [Chloroflexi bacterium]|nr:FG-GAP repeat protein [Chloroflexota bacterium]
MFEYIRQSEYEIRWIENEGLHRAANRTQNLRFTFFPDGFAAEPRDYGDGNLRPWNAEIRLKQFGKSPMTGLSIGQTTWAVDRNAASVLSESVKIDYVNTKEGLRQNFLIHQRPPGNDPLTLEFTVRSDQLVMDVDKEKYAVLFHDSQGTATLRYWDLHVFDANGVKLEAQMLKINAAGFVIGVNDDNAAYPILVDPLTQGDQRYESQSGAQFGFSVAATDLYGSGVLVGAPYFDTGNYTDAGKVFMFAGSTALPDTPTWTKEGDQTYGRLGWSVADAGNVDNSHYTDIIIGAPYYDSGGYTDAGKVWIYLSNSSHSLESTASWSLSWNQDNAHLGYAVAGLGDFDVNDYADVAIGAPDYNYYNNDDGMVLIYKGSSSGMTYYTASIGGASSRLGASIAYAGDIDGNDYPDFIAGMPDYSSGGAKGGARVYLYNGSYHDVTALVGEAAGDKFGFSVAGVGDVNGDSYRDVLVGAPYHDSGQSADQGKVYLFLGNSGGISTSASWTAESGQAGACLGISVAGHPFRGDLNGDNVFDFVIGAPFYDSFSRLTTG